MARVDRLTALRRDAELEHQRVQDLHTKGFASQSLLDEAVARRDAATASLNEAKAALDSLVAGTTKEELDQARSALRAASAQVEELTENLARLKHYAPADSLVEALPYKEGETPPIGAPVAVLLRAGLPYARVYVPEPLRASVHAGDTLRVSVDGVDTVYDGTVRFIASEASFTPYFALTRYDRSRLAYIAKIDLPNGEDLPAGVPVEARLPSAKSD